MPTTAEQSLAAAAAHDAAGRRQQARALYDAVLAADPDHPLALWRIAEHDLAQGKPEAAVGRLERALKVAAQRNLPAREFWFALGRAHMSRSDPRAAEVAFGHMLEAAPGEPVAMLSLGSAALAAGDPARAERVLREATVRHPDFAGAWANLAVALSALQRLDDALACARKAVELAPASVAACQIFSAVAIQSGNAAAAVPVCRSVLARLPGHPAVAAALADALKGSGARAEAQSVLAPFVAAPNPAPAILASYGALCVEAGRFADALPLLERAVALDARNPRTWDNLGTAYKRTGQIERAADALKRAVELDPGLTPALCNWTDALRMLCDWPTLAPLEAQQQQRLERQDEDPRWNPFVAIRDETSRDQQLRIARAWSRFTLPPVAAQGPAPIRRRGSRLRIGYLSADLHDHATARLMAGLFEHRDPARTEIVAYSSGPDDGSPMRARLRRSFDRWVEIGGDDDDVAARRIRDDGIDVLVDLKGHTQDSRLAVACHRAAPVQIHYLGFPGTLGIDAISHLVADAITIPPGEESAYHETVLRLPRCYQVNDGKRPLPAATPRDVLRLPDDAIVLACFNQTYKLSRRFFGVWAQAMREVPRSVLWLYVPDAAAQGHLLAEAAREGLPAARLRFAPTAAPDAHIARLRAADLALDVLPCGSHTTGSDALWAGVPMLTCRGDTFAGRVGASLLDGVELPELITGSLAAYVDELLRLLREPERLRAYRDHLETHRHRLPLFDTEGFARDWEQMLEGVAIRA